MIKKLLLIPVVGLFAAMTVGAAAAITFSDPDAGSVGAGSGTVSGYDVTNVVWTLTSGEITGVDFDIDDTDADVDVSTDGTLGIGGSDSFGNWGSPNCTNTAGAVTCSAAAGIDPETVTALNVVAVN